MSQEEQKQEQEQESSPKNNNNGSNYTVYNFESYEMCDLKWKTTSPKMEDDLTQMEDDLTQNGRRPHTKWKMTSHKMEDALTQNGRQPKWNTTKMEDDQNG